MPTPMGEGGASLLILLIQMLISPETPSQTHPKIMFNLLSGHLLAQIHTINLRYVQLPIIAITHQDPLFSRPQGTPGLPVAKRPSQHTGEGLAPLLK